MTRYLRLMFIYVFIFSCSSTEDCLDGINLLPMFGGNPNAKSNWKLIDNSLRKVTQNLKTGSKHLNFTLTTAGLIFINPTLKHL